MLTSNLLSQIVIISVAILELIIILYQKHKLNVINKEVKKIGDHLEDATKLIALTSPEKINLNLLIPYIKRGESLDLDQLNDIIEKSKENPDN